MGRMEEHSQISTSHSHIPHRSSNSPNSPPVRIVFAQQDKKGRKMMSIINRVPNCLLKKGKRRTKPKQQQKKKCLPQQLPLSILTPSYQTCKERRESSDQKRWKGNEVHFSEEGEIIIMKRAEQQPTAASLLILSKSPGPVKGEKGCRER